MSTTTYGPSLNDILGTSTASEPSNDRLSLLTQKREEKISKLAPKTDLTRGTHTIVDGYVEDNGNKLWGADIRNADEMNYLIGYGAATRQGTDDTKRNLYLNGVKDQNTAEQIVDPTMTDIRDYEGALKMGLARAYGNSDYRYIPKAAEEAGLSNGRYGWDSGPMGVDVNKQFMDLSLQHDAATVLEAFNHTRLAGSDARMVRKLENGKYVVQTPEGQKVVTKAEKDAMYGSGSSEYYTGKEALLGVPEKKPSTTDLFDNLRDKIREKESSNNYSVENSLGYIGGYQMGAMALETLGYVKPGTSKKGNSALNDPSNWTGKNGAESKEVFLSNPELQDTAYDENVNSNYQQLVNNGTINGDSTPKEIAGYLAASHLLGANGAKNLDKVDANNISGKTYFEMGAAVADASTYETTAEEGKEPLSAERRKELEVMFDAKVEELRNARLIQANPKYLTEAEQADRVKLMEARADNIGEVIAQAEQRYEADNMGVAGRAMNFGKGFLSALYQEGVLDPVDFFAEQVFDSDFMTEEEKQKHLRNSIGYNPLIAEDAIKKVGEDFDIAMDSKADTWDRVKAVFGGVAEAATTPELLSTSLGTLVAWILPGKVLKAAGWGAKGVKTFRGIDEARLAGDIGRYEASLQKTKALMSLPGIQSTLIGQTGMVTAALGNVNSQYGQFVENNNGVELEGSDKMEWFVTRFGVQMFNQNLDKIVDVGIMKNATLLGTAKDTVKHLSNKEFSNFAVGVGKTLLTASGSMGVEATQEYAQTMMEMFNEKFGSEKFKDVDTFIKFVTDEENVRESGIAAMAGAGGALQFEAVGSIGGVVSGTGSGLKAIAGKFKREDKDPGVAEVEEQEVELAPEKVNEVIDRLKKVTTGEVEVDNIEALMEDIDVLVASNKKLKETDASYAEMVKLKDVAIDKVDSLIAAGKPLPLGSENRLKAVKDGLDEVVTGSTDIAETLEVTEVPKGMNKEQAALTAEKMIYMSLGSKAKGTVDDSYKNSLRAFAEVNGANIARVERMIKNFETVKEEELVLDRGVYDREYKLEKMLAGGKPNEKALAKEFAGTKAFLDSTLNSINELEVGIKAAEEEAHKLNSLETVKGTKAGTIKSIEIGYRKAPVNKGGLGDKYKVHIRYDGNKWVPDLDLVNKMLDAKRFRRNELQRVINNVGNKGYKYLGIDVNMGVLMTPETESTDVKKARSMDTGYYNNAIAKANTEMGLNAVAINKVIVDQSAGGYSPKWKASGDMYKANTPIINQGEYKAEDLVLVNAMGSFDKEYEGKDGKKYKMAISSLYGKKEGLDHTAKENLIKAMEAGATIILDREYNIATGKDGARMKKLKSSVHNFMANKEFGQEYVRIPGTSVFMPANRLTEEKLAEIDAKTRAAAAEKMKITNAIKKLATMKTNIEAGVDSKGDSLSEEQVAELRKEYSVLASGTAEKMFSKEAISKLDDGAVEEVVDNLDADTTVAEVIQDVAEDSKNTPESRLARLEKRVNAEFNAGVKAARSVAEKDENVIAQGDLDGLSPAAIVLAKKQAEAAKVEDKLIGEALAEWATAIDEGLTGKELDARVDQILAGKELDTDGTKKIAEKVLEESIGATKGYVYEKVYRKVAGEGKNAVESIQALPTRKEFTAEEIAKFPSREAEKHPKEGYILIPIAIRKVEIDPNKLVKVSNTTVLNTVGIGNLPVKLKGMINSFIDKAKDALHELSNGEQLTDKEAVNSANWDNNKGIHWLHDSPARGMLFNKEGHWNHAVLAAMKVSVLDTLLTDKRAMMKGYKNLEQVAFMFGVMEHEVTPEMLKFASEVGMFRKTAADKIGKGILQSLGMTRANMKGIGVHQYERLVADLGNTALLVAEKEGLIEDVGKESSELATLLGVEKDSGKKVSDGAKVHFINVPTVKKKIEGKTNYMKIEVAPKVEEAITEFGEMVKDMPSLKTRKTGPQTYKPTKEQIEEARTEVRNDSLGRDVPEEAADTIEHMMNTGYLLNVADADEFLRLYKENTDSIKKQLGWIDIGDNEAFNALPHREKEVQEAINMDIEDSIRHLAEFLDVNRGKADTYGNINMYFIFSYVNNQRYHLDSNTINPQADKLHRFLVAARGHLSEVDVDDNGIVTNKSNVDISFQLRQAIGQALGYGIDKEDNLSIIEFANVMMELSVDQLAVLKQEVVEKGSATVKVNIAGKNVIEYKVKADHLTHTLQGIKLLVDLKKKKKSKSFITAEFDALTSGYSNKLMQFPVFSEEKMHKEFSKVGILTQKRIEDLKKEAESSGVEFDMDRSKGDSMNNLLAKGTKLGFLDSYKTLAFNVFKTVSESVGKYDVLTRNTLNSLKSVLPGPEALEGKAVTEISKVMRDMFKPGFMVFNYSASISTIRKNLSIGMVRDAFKAMAKADLTNDADAGTAALKGMYKQFETNLRDYGNITKLQEAIRTQPEGSIGVPAGGGKLFDELVKYFDNSYGEAIEAAFNEEFKEFIDIQDLTNDAFKVMFRVFETKFTAKLKEASKKGVITKDDMKDAINELWSDFPYIAGPLSKGIEGDKDGITVYSEGKSTASPLMQGAYPAQSRKKDGKAIKVNHIVKQIEEAVSAGSVLPFHAIDGALMSGMINEFAKRNGLGDVGILGIHDAKMGNIGRSDEQQWLYNKAQFEVNKGYSIFDNIEKMLNGIDLDVKFVGSTSTEGLKSLATKSADGKLDYKNVPKEFKIAVKLLQDKVKDQAKVIREVRERVYGENGMLSTAYFSNMVGSPGGMYSPGDTNPDMSYVESFKGLYRGPKGKVEVVSDKKPTTTSTGTKEEQKDDSNIDTITTELFDIIGRIKDKDEGLVRNIREFIKGRLSIANRTSNEAALLKLEEGCK